ncbi:MAG: redoxin domain-containing protein, partial [Bacteroidota bacterium]
MASTTTHKGNTLKLSGELPKQGTTAPDFTVVSADLKEISLADLGDKIKVLLCMPSLDTSTCALETKTFNKKLGENAAVSALVI